MSAPRTRGAVDKEEVEPQKLHADDGAPAVRADGMRGVGPEGRNAPAVERETGRAPSPAVAGFRIVAQTVPLCLHPWELTDQRLAHPGDVRSSTGRNKRRVVVQEGDGDGMGPGEERVRRDMNGGGIAVRKGKRRVVMDG